MQMPKVPCLELHERILHRIHNLVKKHSPEDYVWLEHIPARKTDTRVLYIDIDVKDMGIPYTVKLKRYFYPVNTVDNLSVYSNGKYMFLKPGKNSNKSLLLEYLRENFIPVLNKKKQDILSQIIS